VAIAIRPSLAWNAAIIVLIWGFSQQHFRKSELRQIGTTGNLRITRMRSFLLDVFPGLSGKSVVEPTDRSLVRIVLGAADRISRASKTSQAPLPST
jgi:hypothetical protein